MSNNKIQPNENSEILNTLQFVITLITLIIIIAILFKKNYEAFPYLSLISIIIALSYFIFSGMIKIKNYDYCIDRQNHIKGVYFLILIVFVIIFAVTTLFFFQIYSLEKTNDILSVASLGLTISTPYLTEQINKL